MTTESTETPKIVGYNIMEAAKKVGVSRWTLHRAIKDGKLQVYKVGGSVIILPGDLADYAMTYRGGEGVPGA